MNFEASMFTYKFHLCTSYLPTIQLCSFIMTFFNYEVPTNGSKRCNFLKSTLKDAFSNCRTFCGRLSSSIPEEEYNPASNDDDEQEVFVSAVISRYMEDKARRKSRAFLPSTGELFITQKTIKKEESDNAKEKEDFFSVDSCFSRCSSMTNMEEFLSVKSNLSRCSSLNRLDFPGFQRRSIILELCHCEGWPFGLCRKVLLLPPLPKTPAEPWSWRRSKSARLVK